MGKSTAARLRIRGPEPGVAMGVYPTLRRGRIFGAVFRVQAPPTPARIPGRLELSESRGTGKILWTDLTVAKAGDLRDFYQNVVGWKWDSVSMGDYSDFTMIPSGSEEPVAGICHARGPNAELPPVWLIYIAVESMEASLVACRDGGGEVLVGPREMGPDSSYAIIRDPAGAVCALYQTGD